MVGQLEGIGRRLKQYRIESKLPPEQIAEALGVSRAAVYRIESGSIAKVETLNRLAALFGSSLPALLGAGVECYTDAFSYFRRLQSLERECDQRITCIAPMPYTLTAEGYMDTLRGILMKSPSPKSDLPPERGLEATLRLLSDRRREDINRHASLVSLINPQEIERWLKIGTVGREEILSEKKTRECRLLAREQVENLLSMMRSEPMGLQIALVEQTFPSISFQILRMEEGSILCLSPFRCVGEFPNLQTGVGMVTADKVVVSRHEQLANDLWKRSIKGHDAVARIQDILSRSGV